MTGLLETLPVIDAGLNIAFRLIDKVRMSRADAERLAIRQALRHFEFSSDTIAALKKLNGSQPDHFDFTYLIGQIAIRQRDSRLNVDGGTAVLQELESRGDISIEGARLIHAILVGKTNIRSELAGEQALLTGTTQPLELGDLISKIEDLNDCIVELDNKLGGLTLE